MTHTMFRNLIQLVFIASGVFCLGLGVFLASPFWIKWRFVDGIVELRPSFDHPSQMVRQVIYMRANGLETLVPFPEETLPMAARSGDHVRVAYIPGGKTAMVYTFRSAWGAAALAGTLGVVFTLLGLYFCAQRTMFVTGSNAQTPEQG
jgi:hypothetical protein